MHISILYVIYISNTDFIIRMQVDIGIYNLQWKLIQKFTSFQHYILSIVLLAKTQIWIELCDSLSDTELYLYSLYQTIPNSFLQKKQQIIIIHFRSYFLLAKMLNFGMVIGKNHLHAMIILQNIQTMYYIQLQGWSNNFF